MVEVVAMTTKKLTSLEIKVGNLIIEWRLKDMEYNAKILTTYAKKIIKLVKNNE